MREEEILFCENETPFLLQKLLGRTIYSILKLYFDTILIKAFLKFQLSLLCFLLSTNFDKISKEDLSMESRHFFLYPLEKRRIMNKGNNTQMRDIFNLN